VLLNWTMSSQFKWKIEKPTTAMTHRCATIMSADDRNCKTEHPQVVVA